MPRLSRAGARRTCSMPRPWPRTARVRPSRMRPPRGSSRSPPWRWSSQRPARGRRRRHDALGRARRPPARPGRERVPSRRRRRAPAYDCQATAIHARRLHAAGLLNDAELADAEARLIEIAADGGLSPEDEDVHSAIERLLGEVGRKIHAGGPATIRSLLLSASTSSTPAPKPEPVSPHWLEPCSTGRRPRRRRPCPATPISSAPSR